MRRAVKMTEMCTLELTTNDWCIAAHAQRYSNNYTTVDSFLMQPLNSDEAQRNISRYHSIHPSVSVRNVLRLVSQVGNQKKSNLL